MRRQSFFDELRIAACSWLRKRVVVFGDSILDEFICGRTDRISREAPVVVVRYEDAKWACGGAANAARNIKALGGYCSLVSLTGDDEHGNILRGILRSEGLAVAGVVKSKRVVTTVKTRVMASDYHAQLQQVLRIDRENGSVPGEGIQKRLLRALERELHRADAVLMSDYGQGVFSNRVIESALKLCKLHDVPVIVDSRYKLARFRGGDVLTPNEVEAACAAGVEPGGKVSLEAIGRKLLRITRAKAILVTRGKFGMALFSPGQRTELVDVVGSREATDVTGAGDTVSATVALSRAIGCDMRLAMHLANIAASIVVMKRGTAVATASELLAAIDSLERCERTGRR